MRNLERRMSVRLNALHRCEQIVVGGGTERWIARAIRQGRRFSLDGRSFMPGPIGECHRTVLRLLASGKIERACYGFAFAGVHGDPQDLPSWYEHSWGLCDGKIIETTRPFARYFGLALSPADAADFDALLLQLGAKECRA